MTHPTSPHYGFITLELLFACVCGTLFLFGALMIVESLPGSASYESLSMHGDIVYDIERDGYVERALAYFFSRTLTEREHEWRKGDTSTSTFGVLLTSVTNFISDCSAHIRVTASWQSTRSRVRSMERDGVVSVPNHALALGRYSCDPIPGSDWRDPEHVGETPRGDITGLPTSLSYAYIDDTPYAIVTTESSTQTPDLWIISLADTEHPTVISSLETGDDTHTRGLLDSVVFHDGDLVYAYVLQNSGTNQLQVIDLHNPYTPTLRHTRSFDTYGVSPLGSNPEGRVLALYDEKLYVGLRTTIGPELLSFDIQTSKESPRFVGSIPSSFDHSIYDMVPSSDGFLFLAIKPGNPPSGLPTRELMVIDVTGVPRDTGGGFNATSSSGDTEGGMTLTLLGNRLYMGRERVNNINERDFYVFDVSSSTKPSTIATKRLGIPTTSLQGTPRILDIVVHHGRAFVATTDPVHTLRLYDVQSDPYTIALIPFHCESDLSIPRLNTLLYQNNTLYSLFGLTAQLGVMRDAESMCTP